MAIVSPRRRLDLTLALDQVAGCDAFVGQGIPTSWKRLYGGQILAQAVIAAGRSVPEGLFIHSLQAYFLLSGDSHQAILYQVHRIHSGKTFHRRTVVAIQGNREIFSIIVSFHRDEPGPHYQIPKDDLVSYLKLRHVVSGFNSTSSSSSGGSSSSSNNTGSTINISSTTTTTTDDGRNIPDHLPSPEELVAASGEDVVVRDHVTGSCESITVASGERWVLQWRRHENQLDDGRHEQDLTSLLWTAHAAVIAFISDLGPISTIKSPHLPSTTFGHSASLDHTIHFHRRFRSDQWHLFHLETTVAGGARGLASMQVFSQDGELVATVAQEALIRPERSSQSRL